MWFGGHAWAQWIPSSKKACWAAPDSSGELIEVFHNRRFVLEPGLHFPVDSVSAGGLVFSPAHEGLFNPSRHGPSC